MTQQPAPGPPPAATPAAADVDPAAPGKQRLRRAVPVLLGFAAFLVAWHVLRVLGVWEPVLFPGPIEVGRSLLRLARPDGGWWSYPQAGWWRVWESQLGRAMVITIKRLGIGYGLGLSLGMLLSFGFIWLPAVKRGLAPLLIGLQGLPGVAWAPLALIWFGYSENAIVFVTVMGCLFAVAMGFSDAFANVPPIYGRAARNMGASGLRLLVRVRIPSATPSLIGSAKVAWSFAWRSLLSAEIIISSLGGLGFLLNSGREVNDVAQVMASMVMAIVVGIAFERLLFARLETRVRLHWGLAGSAP